MFFSTSSIITFLSLGINIWSLSTIGEKVIIINTKNINNIIQMLKFKGYNELCKKVSYYISKQKYS